MDAPKVGRRLGNRKTTTGCITCKARRIKCGEERPSCRRCTSTGRRCDGYKEEFIVFRSTHTPPKAPSPDVSRPIAMLSLDAEEAQALQFFVEHAASAIAGWINVDFWTRIIPQLSQSQPAIQHAAIAIGSLIFRSRTSTADHSAVEPERALHHPASQAFALDQYGKAIKATLATIDEGRGDVGLATVTCVLFVCIEALQGHEREAISLFHQGHNALEGWEAASTATTSVRADIHPVFSSLGRQFMMFDPFFVDYADIVEAAFFSPVPSPFPPMTSLAEARTELLTILAFAQNVTAIAAGLKWQRTNPTEERQFAILVERQLAGDRLLQAWYSRFLEINQFPSSDSKQWLQQKIGRSILLQQYHILRIYLAGNLQTAECFNDNFMPEFRTIVAEATSLAKLTSQTTSTVDFCLEMGSIPPLYWTVIKCRDPTLRRQALSLLMNGPLQEGLWDRRIMIKVGCRVIQLEEGLGEEDTILSNVKGEEGAARLPPEEMRVKGVRINLRTVIDGRQGDVAEFRTLPNGQAGDWHVRQEFIIV